MVSADSFGSGLCAGMLFLVGAQALHWFITPMAHPDASAAQAVGVTAQAVLGFGAAGWLVWRAKRARAADGVARPRRAE